MQILQAKNIGGAQDALGYDDFKILINDMLFLIRQLFESGEDEVNLFIGQVIPHFF